MLNFYFYVTIYMMKPVIIKAEVKYGVVCQKQFQKKLKDFIH